MIALLICQTEIQDKSITAYHEHTTASKRTPRENDVICRSSIADEPMVKAMLMSKELRGMEWNDIEFIKR
jgi:hypothetical protein